MARNLPILLILALIIALPFVFRQPPPQGEWKPGNPVIVIVSPHNEAIRYEFAEGFSKWHKTKYGTPVKIDWRNIGGTTEISRYLASEYTAAAKAWWVAQNKPWPGTATDDLTKPAPPTNAASKEVWEVYRKTDSPDAIGCKIDLFFGGGEFDHSSAFASGFAVPVLDLLLPELFRKDGVDLIPETLSGETWRTASVMGNAVSAFGIIYNVDRLKDLGITNTPAQWKDLADYRYFKQVGLADPTKSGSIAKAFEMIVHQQMRDAAVAAGFTDEQIARNEKLIAGYIKEKGKAYQRGDVPENLKAYQQSLEKGFANGLTLLQKIGANARYFTDSASKVPIDVSMGDAAVGMAIDFYGRYQAEASHAPDGTERMRFVTPVGGTSVSVDPISLLRGAPSKEIALHFMEFLLSEDGQKLWTYKQGQPGGPVKYTLRRLPIRRSFYPSTAPSIQQIASEHLKHAADDLSDPVIDPYELAKSFTYYRRWTGEHFSILRDIVRSMCMDSGEELRDAWSRTGGQAQFPPMPTVRLQKRDSKDAPADVPLSWRTAPDIRRNFDSLDYMREWTRAFRAQYEAVAK